MSFVPKLKEFVLAKRWYIIGVTLTLVLAGGGLYAYKQHTYKQSPEFFLTQLNAGLQSNNLPLLATLIDFRSLTDDISKQIVRAPIPQHYGKIRETEYIVVAEQIQNDFILAMQTKDEEKPANPNPNPLAPLEPLPADFAMQISGKFRLQGLADNKAIITTTINHPRLKKDYKLSFLCEQKPHWMVTKFINFNELLAEYIDEENKLEVLRENKFLEDNIKFAKRMSDQFSVSDCTAFVHTASDGHTTLFVRVRGYNRGPFIIQNMTFATEVIAETSEGPMTIEKDLNMAARILPGVDLQDSYSIELDKNKPEDMLLINTTNFVCKAKPRMMTLGNGTLLFTKRHRLQRSN